jgi:hypothetical protein
MKLGSQHFLKVKAPLQMILLWRWWSFTCSLRKKYTSLPVIANGHLDNPDKASEIIQKREADTVT